MTEEQTTPVPEQKEQETTTQEVSEPKTEIKDEQVEAVEKEIEVKDKAKLDGLTETFRTEMKSLREELQAEYTNKLNEELAAYKTQLDESYADKFKEVDAKLEEVKPRKGLVDVPSTSPYEEMKQEQTAGNPAGGQESTMDLRNPGREMDYKGAQDFLNNLRK